MNRPPAAGAGEGAGGPCPDLETLEALAGGLLSGEDGARAATHAAHCPDCQAILAEVADNLQTLATLKADDGDAPPDVLDDTFDGYEAVREIHRGGQGVVIEARQVSTGRRVAIKLMRDPRGPGLRERIRFDREVEVAARLQHPGIVPIFDRGQTRRGRRYFVMELVDGDPLDVHVAKAKPDAETRVDLFLDLCAAVHAAHQRGVLHRDLKPGNVMVERDGRVRVLDFGLALALGGHATAASAIGSEGAADPTRVTVTGEFMGTLAYASPEQVAGDPDRVDLRTDVYALGVILYWLLTGTHPYSVNGPIAEIIGNITSASPRSMTALRGEIDPDLELIVRKALDKDPDQRYASVAALADDLERLRTGLPIAARAPSALYQLRKFARRNRGLVAALAVAALALVAGTVAASVGLVDARRSARLADERAETARLAEAQAEAALEREQEQRALAERREREAEFRAYCAAIAAAQGALAADDVRAARLRLHETAEWLREWEWSFLHAQLDSSLAQAVAHDGWTWSVAGLPDGRFISAGVDGRVILRDRDGEPLDAVEASDARLYAVAASPTGDRVATAAGDGSLTLVDVNGDTLSLRMTLPAHSHLAHGVAWSADGALFASAGWDSVVVVHDATTDEAVRRLVHPDRVWWVEFDPRGGRVASLAQDNAVRMWDLHDGRLLRTWRIHEAGDWEGSIHQIRLAWSPSGSMIAVGRHDGPIRLLDPDREGEIGTLIGHRRRVRSLAFSPNGSALASVGDDATVRLWRLDGSDRHAVLRGHETEVFAVAWSPSGDRLLTGGKDPQMRLWPAETLDGPILLAGHRSQSIHALAFAPDGRWLASGGAFADPSIRIRELPSGAPLAMLDGARDGHRDGVSALLALDDGERLLSAGWDGRLILWSITDGVPLAARSLGAAVQGIAPIPVAPGADATVGFVLRNGHVATVAIDDLRPIATLRPPGGRADAIAALPDGRSVLVGTNAGDVEEWVVGRGSDGGRDGSDREGPRRRWSISSSRIVVVGVTDDGRHAYAGDRDGGLAIWRLDVDEHHLVRADGHLGAITTASALGDRRILTLGTDRMARIWDVETGQPVLNWLADDDWPVSVAVDATSRTLATAGRAIRLWPVEGLTPDAVAMRVRQRRAERSTAELHRHLGVWSDVRRFIASTEWIIGADHRAAALRIVDLERDDPRTLAGRALRLVSGDLAEADLVLARSLAERAVEAGDSDPTATATALVTLTLLALRDGDLDAAANLLEAAGAGSLATPAAALRQVASALVLCRRGDRDAALALAEDREPNLDRDHGGVIAALWDQVERCLAAPAPAIR